MIPHKYLYLGLGIAFGIFVLSVFFRVRKSRKLDRCQTQNCVFLAMLLRRHNIPFREVTAIINGKGRISIRLDLPKELTPDQAKVALLPFQGFEVTAHVVDEAGLRNASQQMPPPDAVEA